uniref:Biotin carboxyl carrier protein of acetyl-CoA carboxylase n=1 Tax=Caloglossa beccarii TaxID=131038 RepID=A0A1Z1M8Z8_9FLOR|nr:acetyl-CoA carboxylase biotin carboxyl carrier protein [Caloglossa beccarii]ARW62311.1 acetyl-CoA carboxylase biotin carboxyl carrier protein [Caloglossa beccarii]
MTLKIKDLKRFISSIKTKKVNQINLRSKNLEILVNKKFFYSQILKYTKNLNKKNTTYTKIFHQPNTSNYNNNKSINNKIHEESETYSTIISPMVGTFYRSPAPNEQPFIQKNDIVNKKQIVCIIEAMKLMNEIESEVHGEIIDILVNDGDIVDCGQALIKVKTK